MNAKLWENSKSRMTFQASAVQMVHIGYRDTIGLTHVTVTDRVFTMQMLYYVLEIGLICKPENRYLPVAPVPQR